MFFIQLDTITGEYPLQRQNTKYMIFYYIGHNRIVIRQALFSQIPRDQDDLSQISPSESQ